MASEDKCPRDRELAFIVELQREMRADIKQLLQEIPALKVKTSIWGGLSGGVSGLLVALAAIIFTIVEKKT